MNIFNEICAALREDKHVMLATIIGTSGSTPAPSQSRMLVRTKGKLRSIGTIGGGCLDLNVLTCVEDEKARGRASIISTELNDDVGDTGLACGGTVEVLVEPLDESMLSIYEKVVEAQEAGEDCVLATVISKGGATEKVLLDIKGEVMSGSGTTPTTNLDRIRDCIRTIGLEETAVRFGTEEGEVVVELLQAAPPLVIFGGGHVGKVVSRVASLAGFRVTVVDDRPEYANEQRFPEGAAVVCEKFEAAFEKLNVNNSTYVVIVTRGHKHDELVLEKAVQFNPRYVGMIGSRRKVLLTFKNLEERGVPRDKLAKVCAPIGLDIGAKTADEIGVSIVAELVAIRRRAEKMRELLSRSRVT